MSFRSFFRRVSSELQELIYPAIDCNIVWKTQLSPMIKNFMQNPHPDQESCKASLIAIRAFNKQRREVQQHLKDFVEEQKK